jgi:hypothetical protein
MFVQALYERNAAIFVFEYLNTTCWSRSDKFNPHLRMVLDVLVALAQLGNGFESIPLHAVGVSAGSMLISRVAAYVSFDSVVSYISPLLDTFVANTSQRTRQPQLLLSRLPMQWRRSEPPRIVFVNMPKDKKKSPIIRKQVRPLRSQGLHVHLFEALEELLTPTSFHEFLPSRVTREESPQLTKQLIPTLIQEDAQHPASFHVTLDPFAHYHNCVTAFELIMLPTDDNTGMLEGASSTATSATGTDEEEGEEGDEHSVGVPPECCHPRREGESFRSNGKCHKGDKSDRDVILGEGRSEAGVRLVHQIAYSSTKLLKTFVAFHEMTWSHLDEVMALLFDNPT